MTCQIRRAKPLLGTLVEITVQGNGEDLLGAAVRSAFQAVQQVQTSMSYHDPESELSWVNRHAFRREVRINSPLLRVLRAALDLSTLSRGAFDVTIAPLLEAWGLLPTEHNIPCAAAGFRTVALSPEGKVRFLHPHTRIDLGGIAKGFAVDQAVRSLRAAGVRAGIVNAGGDMRAFGQDSFPVKIRNPLRPTELLLQTTLHNQALANSGIYFQRHIADPRTGDPAVEVLAAGVFAKTCMVADAMTKVLMVGAKGFKHFPWYKVQMASN